MRHLTLTQNLLGRPLALSGERVAVIRQLLAQGADDVGLFGRTLNAGFWQDDTDSRPVSQLSDIVAGVGIIRVSGVLMPGCGGSPWWDWVTLYGDIDAAMREAMGNEDVKAIALHIDSPGGTVAGCFDTADRIYAARGTKPIVAIVDEAAYSAAYAIASAADRIILPRTGGVGSIGVVGMHVDITGMLDQAGIKVTTFQFGDQKTDSYPTTPMTDGAASRFQADIDEMGELFVATVARNRGLSPDAVRETQAATFLGQHGVAAGLADAVMSADNAMMDVIASLG
ncbi:S49 family peptidase [Komagataeibacter diospyri]|uniref:S49 family peptidase n=1 Tax=Komagataeibacter diospyri TaxID=1932662 RepID=UPI003757BED6